MYIKLGSATFGDFAHSRTLIGIVGAVLANVVILGSIEQITRLAAHSLG
jgi:hypothetical protein